MKGISLISACVSFALSAACPAGAADQPTPYARKDTALATWRAWYDTTRAYGVKLAPHWFSIGPFDAAFEDPEAQSRGELVKPLLE